jgi:hypothetical protein
MQFLDLTSLLRLARCSKFTLSSASSEFSFQGLSPIPFHYSEDRMELAAQIRSSLLRFADIFINEWTHASHDDYTEWWPETKELDALFSIERLVALDTSERRLELEHMSSYPNSMAKLKTLILGGASHAG